MVAHITVVYISYVICSSVRKADIIYDVLSALRSIRADAHIKQKHYSEFEYCYKLDATINYNLISFFLFLELKKIFILLNSDLRSKSSSNCLIFVCVRRQPSIKL